MVEGDGDSDGDDSGVVDGPATFSDAEPHPVTAMTSASAVIPVFMGGI